MAITFNNRIQHWRTRIQTGPVMQFWRWWKGELVDLLPDSWRSRLVHNQRRIFIDLDQEALSLSLEEGETVTDLERFPFTQDNSIQQQQIKDLMLEQELLDCQRVLLLDESHLLLKDIQMPLAAEGNLAQALSFEMDRHTPFQANNVYLDYQINSRDKEAGQLHTTLYVVPRNVLDNALQHLANAGLVPTGVDVRLNGKPAGINLLPYEKRARIVNQKQRINYLLALVAVVLLFSVMKFSLAYREHQYEKLDSEIETVRTDANRVRSIKTQIEDASEAAGFLDNRRAEMVPTVILLAEITRILPDDTYLDRLVVGKGTVQIQGKSDNAQRLIGLINESPLLDGAAFRSGTRVDPRSQKEIFDLNASVVQETE